MAAALEDVASRPCDLTCRPEVSAAVPGGEISPALLEEWRRHLLADHMTFRKDCAACVQASATGHQHRRAKHVMPCVLSLDIAGPFRVKGEAVDTGGSGTWEPKARYLLVGSYRAPAIAFRDKVSENPELPPDLDVPEGEDDPLTLAPDEDAALAGPPGPGDSSFPPEPPASELAEPAGSPVDEDERLKLEIKGLMDPVPMKAVYTVRSLTTRKKPEVLLAI